MTDFSQSIVEDSKRIYHAFPMHIPGAFYAHGLSKRELFAAMSMQGLLARDCGSHSSDIAEQSVTQADALIAALAGEDK